ncbi:polyketide synthase, partial [Pontibacter sp. HJ8]
MKNKTELRETIFRHLDGIVTAPTAFAMHEKGVLDYLLSKQEASLEELVTTFQANEGYLNVALRVLSSQGWLEQQLDNETAAISYRLTDRGAIAFPLVYLYKDVVQLMKLAGKF